MSRGRAPCCQKVGLNKGLWTLDEDKRLIAYINKHGYKNWRALPKQAGLLRCGKSCRLRWINYLCPDIKRGNFSKEEEDTIINLHELLGNKWSKIAASLPGRTDNEIKNMWNTHLKKRLKVESVTPVASVDMIQSHEDVSLSHETSSNNTDGELSFLDNMVMPWDMLDDGSMVAPPSMLAMTDNANNTHEIAMKECERWFASLEEELGLAPAIDEIHYRASWP